MNNRGVPGAFVRDPNATIPKAAPFNPSLQQASHDDGLHTPNQLPIESGDLMVSDGFMERADGHLPMSEEQKELLSQFSNYSRSKEIR